MPTATLPFRDIIAQIKPDDVHEDARRGRSPQPRPKVNAHIHLPPNFSAFETVEQAVELASKQRISVLGASNYYDYSVYTPFADLAAQRGIFPLFGIEIICLIDDLVASGVKINDPGNPGKMYVCGKGITQFSPMNPRADELLAVIRDNDSKRMAEVVRKLSQFFVSRGIDLGLTPERVIDSVVARHHCDPASVYLQERHASQAFQEALFDLIDETDRYLSFSRVFDAPPKNLRDAVTVQNEIRGYLLKAGKPAYVPDSFVDFEHARSLVLALGGIPVYPLLADGADPICPYEEHPGRLVSDLKARGFLGAEFITIRNSVDTVRRYALALREAGLFVTGGTEHNTREMLPIEPACRGGEPVPDDLKELFWEGACVIAAHQHYAMHGLPGFVDDDGQPNPAYSDDNHRIDAFHRQGAALIAAYKDRAAALK